MADSNMTIASTARAGQARMRKVTFTETTAGAGNATTSFEINGKLLAVMHTGGDGAWNFTLSNGTATLFTSGSLDNTTKFKSLALQFDGSQQDAATENVMFGIPMVGETLLCTTTNSGTLAAAITVYYEESATVV
jgi:hypothetical protein